jgi:hypothetical protein
MFDARRSQNNHQPRSASAPPKEAVSQSSRLTRDDSRKIVLPGRAPRGQARSCGAGSIVVHPFFGPGSKRRTVTSQSIQDSGPSDAAGSRVFTAICEASQCSNGKHVHTYTCVRGPCYSCGRRGMTVSIQGDSQRYAFVSRLYRARRLAAPPRRIGLLARELAVCLARSDPRRGRLLGARTEARCGVPNELALTERPGP